MMPAAQPICETPTETGPRILIVDDNHTMTRALAKLLTNEGMQPVECVNATEALKEIERCAPAAAVVDIHLPDLSGLILSQQLRARFGDAMPIIVVSGDGSREVLSSLAHVGATYFFSKPVKAQALIEQLRQLLK